MIFCGADPGNMGAVAFIDDNSKLIDVVKFNCHTCHMPEFIKYKPTLSCIEKLWGIPVSSAATNFDLGGHYYRWVLLFDIMELPLMDIAAKTWQAKILNFKGSSANRASKKASIAYITKKYPQLKLPQRTLKEIDESSGLSDAICLALYARFTHMNKDI